jgi:hypothetical protein
LTVHILTRGRALAAALALVAAQACSFSVSTANLSSLKLGKDKDAAQETSTFKPSDLVYAVAVVSNAGEDVKVKGRLAVVDVEGEKAGPIPSTESTVDLPGGGTASFTLSPPPSGWPAGKYKIEVLVNGTSAGSKDFEVAP